MSLDTDYQNRLDNFKKYVLDVAIKQINEHSDLTCSYEQRKTGRTVTHLIFTFAKKPEPKPTKADKPNAKQTKSTKKPTKADPNADRPKPPIFNTPAPEYTTEQRLKAMAEIKKLRAAVGLA